jgi:hypothetical protein
MVKKITSEDLLKYTSNYRKIVTNEQKYIILNNTTLIEQQYPVNNPIVSL